MKKDILDLKIEDLAVVVTPTDDDYWDVFLINMKYGALRGVIVASRGYGEDEEGYARKTSTLRHFFEQIEARASQKIETIPKELFWLSHEYWVSFQYDGHMYDKKYIFVTGSLESSNFTHIPILDTKGVMLR
jgi:hypothetical protein